MEFYEYFRALSEHDNNVWFEAVFSLSYLVILVLNMPVKLIVTNTGVRGKEYRQSQKEIITSYQSAIISCLNGHSLRWQYNYENQTKNLQSVTPPCVSAFQNIDLS
jgi:hypothetical protein